MCIRKTLVHLLRFLDFRRSMENWTFEFFNKKIETMEQLLHEIKNKEIQIMAQIDDLNAAIKAEDVELTTIQDSIVKIGTDIDALLAKIAAGGTTTDLTAQLQAIQAHVAALTTANQQLVDDDTKASK